MVYFFLVGCFVCCHHGRPSDSHQRSEQESKLFCSLSNKEYLLDEVQRFPHQPDQSGVVSLQILLSCFSSGERIKRSKVVLFKHTCLCQQISVCFFFLS